jgi:hypothetical protein
MVLDRPKITLHTESRSSRCHLTRRKVGVISAATPAMPFSASPKPTTHEIAFWDYLANGAPYSKI